MTNVQTVVAAVSEQTGELFQFHRGQDVFFMLMLVAFLMMFIRRYEWGVALATLLVFATSFPLYILADRKSTRLNSSHVSISYAVFCLKKKKAVYFTCLLSFLDLLLSFILPPLISTLFPYTTLFRSRANFFSSIAAKMCSLC